MATLAFHPLANLLPEMEQDEYGRLVDDIKANGQIEPIWLYEGKILDGRHRYLACQDAKREPITRIYEGNDPVSFVRSLNLHRRHLTESQRSFIASKLETMKHGDNQHTGGDANLHVLKREDAARLMNVSPRSVATAAFVRENAAPEITKAVEKGQVAVSAAAEVAKLPEPEQREIAAAGPGAIKKKAKEIRESKKAPAPAPQPEPAPQPTTDNVVSLGNRLEQVPSFEQVERQVEQESLAQEEVEDFDPKNIEQCARAISGALTSFEIAPISGRDFWRIYGRDPGRKTYFALAKAAHATLTQIIDVYVKEYDDEPTQAKSRRSPR